MELKEMRVRLTFIEDVLGTANSDPNIHEEFIASKAEDAMKLEEEIAALGVDAVVAKSKTVFPKDENGNPFVWDYQIKGFFKGACGFLRDVKGSESSKMTSYKKKIDGNIFVKERIIPYKLNGEMGSCQRQLRAQTMQGERIALANSDAVPAGSSVEFTIRWFEINKCNLEATIKEWLNYGELSGIGQWRNSGKGRFTWEEI